MNEWMNEWMNKWMIEWMNEWMNEWINDWMNEWMNEWRPSFAPRWIFCPDQGWLGRPLSIKGGITDCDGFPTRWTHVGNSSCKNARLWFDYLLFKSERKYKSTTISMIEYNWVTHTWHSENHGFTLFHIVKGVTKLSYNHKRSYFD